MSYNEAETRYQLIDPILREKGYKEWRNNHAGGRRIDYLG